MDLEPDARKVSTRLAELIEPHLAPEETLESYKALVALGAMAWNVSLVPAEERVGLVRAAVRKSVAIGLPLTEDWLNALIARKILLFPSDDRFVESYEVVIAPDGRFTVFVVSSIDG